MKIIRVVAVGLLTSVLMMIEFSQLFFSLWLQAEGFNSWSMALNGVSPNSASAIGFGSLPVLIFCFLTTGIGLLFSSTVYSRVDDFLVDFQKTQTRNFGLEGEA